jgi:hypothetical protein
MAPACSLKTDSYAKRKGLAFGCPHLKGCWVVEETKQNEPKGAELSRLDSRTDSPV